MKITFLLGNGFDIGLGLETSYESFYKEYCNSQPTDNANISKFKAMLKNRDENPNEKIIDWSDFEKAFGKHSLDFSITQKSSYIERFEDFVASFNAYLEKQEKRIDFSDTELIAQTMKKAVTSYFHIRAEDEEEIFNRYKRLSGQRIYSFISFNYTKSVDRCARILKQHLRSDNSRDVGEIIHIHGFIEENMIMGVNDASQISNLDFAKDIDIIREIVKPQQNSDMRTNYEKNAIDVINSSNIICIYGMSIGDTDKKWWSYIAQWLAKSEQNVLVILKYDKKYDKRFPFVQNKFIDAIVNNFLELSEQPDEVKTAIRSRIFVGMNYNVFEMKLCDEKVKDSVLETELKIANGLASTGKFKALEKETELLAK